MVACYYKNDDNPSLVKTINSGVCLGSGSSAGFYSCCFPWDTCLPNGFCKTNTTYYSALCTDQTLQDSSCQHGCGGLYRTGLQYDTAASVWKCCNQNDRTCSTGTNATFSGPAPQQLLAQTRTIVDFIPSSTASSSSMSSTSAGAGTTTGSTTSISTSASASAAGAAGSVSSSNSPGGLSTGAKAGVGVGVAVVVIALIAGLVFWLLKRRRNNAHAAAESVQPAPAYPAHPSAGQMSYNGAVEAPAYEKTAPNYVAEADSSTSGSMYNKPQQQRVHEMG